MDELDKILNENREAFEEEPRGGHFERFNHRLNAAEPKRKNSLFTPFVKVAAVVVIILLSANLFIALRNHKPEVKVTEATKTDFGEAAIYYTSKINLGIRDLEKMAGEGIGSKQEVIQIKHELSEMDSLFVHLKQEYKNNPNDERIINAMIEYYQTKLDIVNTIKTDLENVKQLKNTKHENPEI